MSYFIVRRTFKCKSGIKHAGSIIEPADIRDFKYRLRDKYIVEINEQNFDSMHYLFSIRYGIDIVNPEHIVDIPKVVEPVVEPGVEPVKVIKAIVIP